MRPSPCSISTLALSSSALGQVVQWDIAKRDALLPRLHPRAGSSFDSNISNDKQIGAYFVSVKVGTPDQELSLQLDTGSSDVWVPAVSADQCRNRTAGGCPFGSCKAPREPSRRGNELLIAGPQLILQSRARLTTSAKASLTSHTRTTAPPVAITLPIGFKSALRRSTT